MSRNRSTLTRVAAPLAAFTLALGALQLFDSSSEPSTVTGGDASTDGRVRAARAAIRQRPADPRGYTALGEAYVQRARESGDPRGAYMGHAERAFSSALRRDPRDVTATIGLGTVALNAHDFRRGLKHGLRARRLAPGLVRPYSLLVDAQIELGRYDDAARSLQRMLDLKPNLAAYARASYYRELHGDRAGALEAMRLAVSAGGEAPEQVAYVQTLLGDLELGGGRLAQARRAYRLALSRLPGYVDARFGLARAAVQAGNLSAAVRRLRDVVAERPDPDHLLALAEVELALGRRGDARRHIERARAREAALLAGGARPDAGVVVLEATYGDRKHALRLARQVWRAAPSVTSADALGWALTRAGRPRAALPFAHRALRLHTERPEFHYHAGMAALAAARPELARRHLRRALELSPAFSPLEAPRARRALARLDKGRGREHQPPGAVWMTETPSRRASAEANR